MWINRRRAIIGTASLLLSRHLSGADAENALFWTVTPPGRRAAVLFGYARIAAAVVPDIVKDGDALVAASQRVVMDMPLSVRLATVQLRSDKPILQAVSPQIADRLRKFLATTHGAPLVDRLSGLEVTLMLATEGKHTGNGTVAGVIVDYARSVSKPIDQLLSHAEISSAYRPPDMTALENRAAKDAIPYMLDFRDLVGPIGGYFEELYGQRKVKEILRVIADMDRHGVFLPSPSQSDRIREVLFERALSMLTRQSDEQRFMLFPLDILAGPSGLLATFKRKGMVVAPRA